MKRFSGFPRIGIKIQLKNIIFSSNFFETPYVYKIVKKLGEKNIQRKQGPEKKKHQKWPILGLKMAKYDRKNQLL